MIVNTNTYKYSSLPMRVRIVRKMTSGNAPLYLRRNLEWLISKAKTNPNALEKETGVKQPTIHRILTGESEDPRTSSLKPLADYFGVSVADLRDKDLTSLAPNVAAGPELRGKLPLISWVRAGDLCESPDVFHPGDAEEWIDCPVPHSKRSYCLRVSGDSMDGEGGYRDGEIIFVDPEVAATPGRDVIVRTPDGKTTFKRLKEDTEGLYLFGINGKKIIRIPPDTHICGVVIFSGFKR